MRLLLAATAAASLSLGAHQAIGAAADPVGWPQARYDPGGTAFVRLGGPARTLRPFRFRAGSHVWGYRPGMSVWSSPALGRVDGEARLYVGSYDHNVYCLDAVSGEKLWRFATGGGVYATPTLWQVPPALAAEGGRAGGDRALPASVLFVASSDRLVYALDAAAGSRLWIHTVVAWRPTIGGARLSAPAVGRAGPTPAVFVGHWVWDKSLAGHMQAAGLSAIDARDGRRLWTTPLGDSQLSAPLYVPPAGPAERGWLFVASADGNLHALDPQSGQRRWSSPARNAIKASPAFFRVGGKARVVIGSKHGLVRCLDARDGRLLWRFKTAHWVDGSAAVATVDGRPTVFVGSYDTYFYALDGESGRQRWRYRTAGGIYSSPAVARVGGEPRVLFSSWDHHLYCLSARDGSLVFSAFTGRPLWDGVILGQSVWSSPVVAEFGDGENVARAMVYVGSYGGPLHGIPLDDKGIAALARPGSNLEFWISLPVVLAAVTLLALLMTRRARTRRRKTAGAARDAV